MLKVRGFVICLSCNNCLVMNGREKKYRLCDDGLFGLWIWSFIDKFIFIN